MSSTVLIVKNLEILVNVHSYLCKSTDLPMVRLVNVLVK